jgi:hypothetical protein
MKHTSQEALIPQSRCCGRRCVHSSDLISIMQLRETDHTPRVTITSALLTENLFPEQSDVRCSSLLRVSLHGVRRPGDKLRPDGAKKTQELFKRHRVQHMHDFRPHLVVNELKSRAVHCSSYTTSSSQTPASFYSALPTHLHPTILTSKTTTFSFLHTSPPHLPPTPPTLLSNPTRDSQFTSTTEPAVVSMFDTAYFVGVGACWV